MIVSRTLNSAIASSRSAIFRGNSRTAIGINHAVAESHGRNAQVAFDERQDRVLLHHAHLDEHFTKPQTLLRTLGQREIQLLGSNEVGADELLA